MGRSVEREMARRSKHESTGRGQGGSDGRREFGSGTGFAGIAERQGFQVEASVARWMQELANEHGVCAVYRRRPGATGTWKARAATERDLLLMEHLPTVRYLARRIHERLPQHVDLDDLISAGVVGLDRCVLEVRSHQEGAVQELRAVQDSRRDSGFAADAGLEPARAAAQGQGCRRGDPFGDAAAWAARHRSRRSPRRWS